MAITMKLRAGNGEIKLLVSHPSENGQRKDAKSGKLIPAHFVRNAVIAVDGKTVMDAQWGGGVSKDPYLAFRVRGMKAGDKVTVNVEDNKGDKGSAEAVAG
jgi:sulfur-oxidizing protein SoxZ